METLVRAEVIAGARVALQYPWKTKLETAPSMGPWLTSYIRWKAKVGWRVESFHNGRAVTIAIESGVEDYSRKLCERCIC